jgi:hypothetical protein
MERAWLRKAESERDLANREMRFAQGPVGQFHPQLCHNGPEGRALRSEPAV